MKYIFTSFTIVKSCFVIFVLFAFISNVAAEEIPEEEEIVQNGDVFVLTHEQIPFQYVDNDGVLKGFSVEVIQKIFKDADIPIHKNAIRMLPFARAYLILRQHKDTAMFMTVRSKSREKVLKWVGPIEARKKYIYKLVVNTSVNAQTVGEAKKYTIATVRDSSSESQLKNIGFEQIYTTADEGQSFDMFFQERVELISSLELTMVHRLKEKGLNPEDVVKLAVLDEDLDYYLAFNNQTDSDIVRRLQQALDNIRSNGIYDSIRRKYTQ